MYLRTLRVIKNTCEWFIVVVGTKMNVHTRNLEHRED